MVDITNDKEPIVAFNTFEEHFKVCGENISSRAPIEVSYVDEFYIYGEQNPIKNLFLVTKVSHILLKLL